MSLLLEELPVGFVEEDVEELLGDQPERFPDWDVVNRPHVLAEFKSLQSKVLERIHNSRTVRRCKSILTVSQIFSPLVPFQLTAAPQMVSPFDPIPLTLTAGNAHGGAVLETVKVQRTIL
jgi:hypothetical protein